MAHRGSSADRRSSSATSKSTGRQEKGAAITLRDARGRFAKTQKTKADEHFEKMATQQAIIEHQIEALESTCCAEFAKCTKPQQQKHLKMLKKMAKDLCWLSNMVLKLRRKCQEGTISQQAWANKKLPKYIARKLEAEDASLKLGAISAIKVQARCESTTRTSTARTDATKAMQVENRWLKFICAVQQSRFQKMAQEAQHAQVMLQIEKDAALQAQKDLQQTWMQMKELAIKADTDILAARAQHDALQENYDRCAAKCEVGWDEVHRLSQHIEYLTARHVQPTRGKGGSKGARTRDTLSRTIAPPMGRPP